MPLQQIEQTASQLNIPSTGASGNVGIEFRTMLGHREMRPKKWLVTAVVTSAPSDLFIWGALAGGVIDDATDDKWGVHNDKYGRILAGKLGTALAVGTHHFIVEDIGIYTRVYFQKSAGAIDVFLTDILESQRSS